MNRSATNHSIAGWLALVTFALVLSNCSGESLTVPSNVNGKQTAIPVSINKPDGPGPFPAVIVLHACNGLRNSEQVTSWSKRLVAWGYLIAVPDSFSPRGYPNGVCANGSLVSMAPRTFDTYAVVKYLESRPDVQADKIGAIGFSHGGWTVMGAMNVDLARAAKEAAGAQHELAAAIGLYPECAYGPWRNNASGYRSAAPLLMLLGELDDWTPAPPCKQVADLNPPQAQPITMKVYPGAYHAFDTYAPLTRVAAARGGQGAWIGGNQAAREDSIVQVQTFFGKYLQSK